MKKEKIIKTSNYEKILHKILCNSDEVAHYLNGCLSDEDPRVFILALQDVLDAWVEKDEKQAVYLKKQYRILVEQERPVFLDIQKFLQLVGCQFYITPA